jgi:hypothetical protein
MNRYTFVVQIHANGPSTLENLSTHEVIPVSDLTAIGPQIERWLAALPAAADAGRTSSDGHDPRSRVS